MSYACKTCIDEKGQTYSGTALSVQVVKACDFPQCGSGRSSVSWILERATVANLIWPLPDGMTDTELESIFYRSAVRSDSAPRPVPNWREVQLELTKHRTLTLAQLWKH